MTRSPAPIANSISVADGMIEMTRQPTRPRSSSSSRSPPRAYAFDPSKLEFERSIQNVSAPGLYHAEVDPELYRHAHADDLADLRIAGPDNGEIPWLIRRVPAPLQPEERAVTVVDPVQLPDGSARAVLDLGAPGLKHSEARLTVDGDGDLVPPRARRGLDRRGPLGAARRGRLRLSRHRRRQRRHADDAEIVQLRRALPAGHAAPVAVGAAGAHLRRVGRVRAARVARADAPVGVAQAAAAARRG